MKVKEESEKVGLKPNIQKTKIMASGPITSWEIDGETVETVSHTYSVTLLWNESESRLVVSNSLWPHGLYSLWNSPGQNTGVGNLGGFSRPRNRTGVSFIAGRVFTNWAIREALLWDKLLVFPRYLLKEQIHEWMN